jgi:hypothetical protein
VPNVITKLAGIDRLEEQGVDLTELEKLERIAEAVPDFSLAGLKRAGLSESRQIRALSAALSNIEGIRETMAAIQAAPDTLLTDRLRSIRKESPLVRAKFLKERAAAAFAVGQLVGPGADTALAQTLQRSELGLREQAAGRSFFADPETGEATGVRRFVGFAGRAISQAGLASGGTGAAGQVPFRGEGFVDPRLPTGAATDPSLAADSLLNAINRLTGALTKDTDALDRGTVATEVSNGGVATSPFQGANGDFE